MEKSVDAFRTISEVADELDLPQHVLRFWETRFAQIRPLKRAGGRRYYRPADVLLLRHIRQLLYDDGYTIKGVQRLLKDRSSRASRGEPEGGASDEAALVATVPADEPADADLPDDGDVDASPTRESDQVPLAEALDVIEACERILLKALGFKEGKRLQPDDGPL